MSPFGTAKPLYSKWANSLRYGVLRTIVLGVSSVSDVSCGGLNNKSPRRKEP